MTTSTTRFRRGRLVPVIATLAIVAASCGSDDAADNPAPADSVVEEASEEGTDVSADEAESADAAPPAATGDMTVLEEVASVSVQTDWFPSTDHAAIYAAEALGLFEKRNLDVEVIAGGPGVRATNDVITGNAEFGMAIAENAVLAAAEGAELVTFFTTYQESPIGLMVHEESGITSIEDLTEVQIFPGQVFWEVLKAESDVNVEEIAFDGSQAAWLQNKGWAVQAFATTNPNVAVANGADPIMLTATSLGFQSYASALFTTDQYAADNPDVVRAFGEALQEGLESFLADPDPIIAYINSVSPEFEIEIGEASFPVMSELVVSDTTDELGLGTMDGSIWDDVSARMTAAGVISTDVEGSDLWTNEYLIVE